jgi:hypothetical protein
VVDGSSSINANYIFQWLALLLWCLLLSARGFERGDLRLQTCGGRVLIAL